MSDLSFSHLDGIGDVSGMDLSESTFSQASGKLCPNETKAETKELLRNSFVSASFEAVNRTQLRSGDKSEYPEHTDVLTNDLPYNDQVTVPQLYPFKSQFMADGILPDPESVFIEINDIAYVSGLQDALSAAFSDMESYDKKINSDDVSQPELGMMQWSDHTFYYTGEFLEQTVDDRNKQAEKTDSSGISSDCSDQSIIRYNPWNDDSVLRGKDSHISNEFKITESDLAKIFFSEAQSDFEYSFLDLKTEKSVFLPSADSGNFFEPFFRGFSVNLSENNENMYQYKNAFPESNRFITLETDSGKNITQSWNTFYGLDSSQHVVIDIENSMLGKIGIDASIKEGGLSIYIKTTEPLAYNLLNFSPEQYVGIDFYSVELVMSDQMYCGGSSSDAKSDCAEYEPIKSGVEDESECESIKQPALKKELYPTHMGMVDMYV